MNWKWQLLLWVEEVGDGYPAELNSMYNDFLKIGQPIQSRGVKPLFFNWRWSDLINSDARKLRFIQIMDDLFWQPSSYEKEGKRSEFLIDSDMTHWSRRGRATDIQDWECQIQDKDKDTNTKTKTLQKKTKSSPFEWPATGLYIVCWSLKIQIQSCRFESRCACVSISGGSNKWLEVDNLLRCVLGNYWLAMNSGHRWCVYQGKFLFNEYKYFSCSLTNFWSLICCDSIPQEGLDFL